MFKNRLEKNQRRLKAWRVREGVTCYRAYDRDIPEIPLVVDVYEDEYGACWLHVSAYAPRHGGGSAYRALAQELTQVAAEALSIPPDRCVLKEREVVAGGTLLGKEAEIAGADAASFTVREGGARFHVELRGHLDTGLFLDHRKMRRLVADAARGQRLLNLFAYTAAFSVCAGVQGARATTSVDLSPTYCAWAERNLRDNGLRAPEHIVVEKDVFSFLEDSRERWDLAVLDPPSVSRSRRAHRDLDVQRDHTWLIQRTLDRLEPGGVIYFSTNLRGFRLDTIDDVTTDEITAQTISADFPAQPPPHRAWRVQSSR